MVDEDLPGSLALMQGIKAGVFPHTMDARTWVQEWMKVTGEKPEIAMDEGMMLGWFANAIMAGYDTAMFQKDSSLITASEALYGFTAWLTSLKEEITLGATQNAALAAELVKLWCEANQLSFPREGVFPKNITQPDMRLSK